MRQITIVHLAIDSDLQIIKSSGVSSGDLGTERFDAAMVRVATSAKAKQNDVDGETEKTQGAVNTAKVHMLQNPMAMRFFGITLYMQKSLTKSILYKSNEMSAKIHGELGGVRCISFAFIPNSN